jgi:hypothetical protein
MGDALNQLNVVLPRPWHTVGLDLSTHLLVSVCFDSVLVVVDPLTRRVRLFPRIEEVTAEEIANVFLHGVYLLHENPLVLVSDRDP